MAKKEEKGFYKNKTSKGYTIDKDYRIKEGGTRIIGKADTVKEALDFIERRKKEIDAMIEDGIKYIKDDKMFFELYDLYAEQRSWSEYTTNKQRQRFTNYFSEFKELKINQITDAQVKKWYKFVITKVDSQEITMHYANKFFRMMKGCLEIAYEIGRLKRKIDVSYFKNYKSYQESKKNPLDDQNYITLTELNLICDKIFDIPENRGSKMNRFDFCFIIKFLFFTGCRINEARAIKVKDIKIEFENNGKEKVRLCFIKIKNQLEDNSLKSKPIKNKSERTTYIPKEFQQEFLQFLEYKHYDQEDYIFDIKKEGFPLSRKKIHDALERNLSALKDSNLVDEHFINKLSPHGLRYSNTLFFQKTGISEDLSAQNRGHSQKVMLDIYGRLDKDFINSYYTYDYIEGEEIL